MSLQTTDSGVLVPQEREERMPARPQHGGDLVSAIAIAAADPRTDVEKMRVLLDMKREHEADEARKAFVAAMAAFRANPPMIEKTVHVFYHTPKGPVDYWHADIGVMSEKIGEAMAPHGLSFRWTTNQADGGVITVTCILQHELGHFEETRLFASPDQSGGKNSIQAVGSTVQYLRRYTLESASGVVAQSGNFGDAASPEPAEPAEPERITEEQRANLQERLEACGADVAAFCRVCRVQSLSEIPATKWRHVLARVEQRERASKEQSNAPTQ
jgi:hypothetical protein